MMLQSGAIGAEVAFLATLCTSHPRRSAAQGAEAAWRLSEVVLDNLMHWRAPDPSALVLALALQPAAGVGPAGPAWERALRTLEVMVAAVPSDTPPAAVVGLVQWLAYSVASPAHVRAALAPVLASLLAAGESAMACQLPPLMLADRTQALQDGLPVAAASRLLAGLHSLCECAPREAATAGVFLVDLVVAVAQALPGTINKIKFVVPAQCGTSHNIYRYVFYRGGWWWWWCVWGRGRTVSIAVDNLVALSEDGRALTTVTAALLHHLVTTLDRTPDVRVLEVWQHGVKVATAVGRGAHQPLVTALLVASIAVVADRASHAPSEVGSHSEAQRHTASRTLTGRSHEQPSNPVGRSGGGGSGYQRRRSWPS